MTAQPAAANARGVLIMLVTMVVFSVQDGISRLLAEHYPPIFIVMIRYWAFAVFVIALSSVQTGGLVAVARTRKPIVQLLRGLMLAFQICLVTFSFAQLGLSETHAVMAVHPLLVAAGAAIILGERVSPPQWLAIVVGFAGVLVLITPTDDVFDPLALIPLFCAAMYAVYGLLTRWVSMTGERPQTAFFYTGLGGAIGMTVIGPFYWTAMSVEYWAWMAALCITGALGHFLLIKAYEAAEASSLQPFAYLQLALTSMIGVIWFNETLDWAFAIGTTIIVSSGLFAWYTQRRDGRATGGAK